MVFVAVRCAARLIPWSGRVLASRGIAPAVAAVCVGAGRSGCLSAAVRTMMNRTTSNHGDRGHRLQRKRDGQQADQQQAKHGMHNETVAQPCKRCHTVACGMRRWGLAVDVDP